MQLHLFPHTNKKSEYLTCDFIVTPANQEAYSALCLTHKKPEIILLKGEAGSGKTHLAHIWCRRNYGKFLDLNDQDSLIKEVQTNTGNYIIDDISKLNAAKYTLLKQVISVVTQDLGFLLILSREEEVEGATQILTIKDPDPYLAKVIFIKLLTERGLKLKIPIIEYLAQKFPPSFSTLYTAVSLIEQQINATKRPFTLTQAASLIKNLTETPCRTPSTFKDK